MMFSRRNRMGPAFAIATAFATLPLVANAQSNINPPGAQPPAPAANPQRPARREPQRTAAPGTPFAGFGSNSKEPIKVDANKLEVFDKENKAIFTGDVVAVQGQTTMRCSQMVVVYSQSRDAAARPGGAAAAAAANTGGNSIKQIDCEGPVSLLSGTQSATSNKLVYEADKDLVTLTGKVVIADCDNVQRGERAVYDVKTGRATVDAGPTGRVQGVFTPGSDDKKAAAPAAGAQRGAAPAPRSECPTAAKPANAAAPAAPAPPRPGNAATPPAAPAQQPMRLQPPQANRS